MMHKDLKGYAVEILAMGRGAVASITKLEI